MVPVVANGWCVGCGAATHSQLEVFPDDTWDPIPPNLPFHPCPKCFKYSRPIFEGEILEISPHAPTKRMRVLFWLLTDGYCRIGFGPISSSTKRMPRIREWTKGDQDSARQVFSDAVRPASASGLRVSTHVHRTARRSGYVLGHLRDTIHEWNCQCRAE